MNPDLERDLAAWEKGVLSRDELVARHGAEAAVIADTHETLIQATVGLSVDVDDAWAGFSARLDDPGPVVHLARRRLRTTALAVAAALMLAGSAIAVVGPEVGDELEVIAPRPPSSGGGVSDSPATDREDIEGTTPDHDVDDAGVDGSREPNEDPSAGDDNDDSQGDDSDDDDSQGDDSDNDDSDNDDSQGDDSDDDDSQGDDDSDNNDDSQGDDDSDNNDDSQGDDDSHDSDDLSDGDQGGDAQGSDPSDDGDSGDNQSDQD